MKRTGVLISAMVMLVALAIPAFGQQRGPDWPAGGPGAHAHMLLLDAEFDGGELVDVRRCIDLASNQVIPITGHHLHLHVGNAGDAQELAGNVVWPTIVALGFPPNCAELEVD